MVTNPEMLYTAKIEQTWDYPKRMKYIAETDSFIAKDYDSLSYYRNFHQPYGWIKESGTPPCEHLDVIVMTDGHFELGDEVPVRVIGVFKRDDGDYKLVSVLKERNVQDLAELEKSEIEDLNRLYKPLSSEEGWFGKDCAKEVIEEFQRTKKRKIIYTVQHTESEHHVNGHIGAWGNWNLTEHGREQAHNLGEWLGNYGDCKYSFKMYASDLNRASQTADEIQKALGMPDSSVTKTPLLREINLGSGNGQTREWYNAHVVKPPKIYNPDFRSFPDAENDREMWARLHKFYEELMASDDERIIIVSHGGALGFLNAMIMGDSFEDIQRRKIFGHSGGVNRFVVESNGSVEISYLNIWVC